MRHLNNIGERNGIASVQNEKMPVNLHLASRLESHSMVNGLDTLRL